MSEKIFGEIQSAEGMNELAVNLRREKEFDEIRLLCSENDIPEDVAEEFIQGKRLHLVDQDHEKITTGEAEAPCDVPSADYTIEDVRKKLEAELKLYRDGDSKYVVEKLIEQCETDKELLKAIMLPHKSYDKAFQYFYQKSRTVGYKMPQGNMVYLDNDAAVKLSVEYFKLDDASEEKKKEQKKEQKKAAVKAPKIPEKKVRTNAKPEPKKKEPKQSELKSKTNKNEMDGQMSLFDF